MIKFTKSFRHATDGIAHAVKTERNFRIELALAALSIVFAVFLPLTWAERLIVFLTIGIVLSLELFNTAFEHLMDMLSPQFHEKVKIIKDIAAGAVLVSSVSAAIVGIWIFLPRLIALFS